MQYLLRYGSNCPECANGLHKEDFGFMCQECGRRYIPVAEGFGDKELYYEEVEENIYAGDV